MSVVGSALRGAWGAVTSRCTGQIVRCALAAIPMLGSALGTMAAAEEFVDRDYAFRIELSKKWKILDEFGIQALVPDAVAGARDVSGRSVFGALIVEQGEWSDLMATARLVVDTLPGESTTIVALEESTFGGLPSVVVEFTSTVEGFQGRFLNTLVRREGWLYQLYAWGEIRTSRSTLEEFSSGVELLDGPVSGRASVASVQVADGVGWQVRDGVFESVVAGLRCAAPEGLDLAVGEVLATMDESATVGFEAASPEFYFTVGVEYARGVDPEAYVSLMLEDEIPTDRATPFEVEVFGKPRTFHGYTNDAFPDLEFASGVFFEADRLFRLDAWYMKSVSKDVRARLEAAAGALELLDEKRRKELAESLVEVPHPQLVLDADSVVRDGDYRNFAIGFRWNAPDGGWWSFLAGAAAREVDPESCLWIEDREAGITASVYAMLDEAPIDRHHDALLGAFGVAEDPAVEHEKSERGPVAVRISTVVDPEIYSTTHVFSTLTRGAVVVQCSVSGHTGNLRRFESRVQALLDAFELPGSLPERESTDANGIRDHRFGIAFTPPGEGWIYEDETPSEMQPGVSVHTWKRARQEIAIGALAIPTTVDYETWLETVFMQTINEAARRNMGMAARLFASKTPEESASTLGGLPARVLRWRTPGEDPRVYIVRRGGVLVYAIFAAGDREMTSTVARGFRFLD